MPPNRISVIEPLPSKWASPTPPTTPKDGLKSPKLDLKQKALDTVRFDPQSKKLVQTVVSPEVSPNGGVAIDTNHLSSCQAVSSPTENQFAETPSNKNETFATGENNTSTTCRQSDYKRYSSDSAVSQSSTPPNQALDKASQPEPVQLLEGASMPLRSIPAIERSQRGSSNSKQRRKGGPRDQGVEIGTYLNDHSRTSNRLTSLQLINKPTKADSKPSPPIITLQEEFSDSSANLSESGSSRLDMQRKSTVEPPKRTKWVEVAQYHPRRSGQGTNEIGWVSDVPSDPSPKGRSNGWGGMPYGTESNDARKTAQIVDYTASSQNVGWDISPSNGWNSAPNTNWDVASRTPPYPEPRPVSQTGNPWVGVETYVRANRSPDPGHNIRDWDGGWAPPPVEWEDRPSMEPASAFNYRLDEWQRRSLIQAFHLDMPLSNIPYDCEIAPADWIPDTIDGEIPNVWWAIHSKSPDADTTVKPFWARYNQNTASSLIPWVVPNTAIDPTDHSPQERWKAENTSSETASGKRCQHVKAKMANSRRRVSQGWHQPPVDAQNPRIPRNEWSPRADIYLRPAINADMPQCAEIYNHYIERTVFTPELDPISGPQMLQRWENIQDVKLPFLVAVDRKQKHKRARNQPQTIVGFAYADDHNDIKGMYRYTVELEIFVKQQWTRQGVGRTLMDKMISLLDSGYMLRGGYEFDGNDLNYGPGGRRVIGNILVNVSYPSNDRTKLKWNEAWLQQWGYQKTADIPDIGIKLNNRVSHAIFHRKTGTTIDTWAP